jgi:prepilin-type N-terminal cleavage/methylation domain-containing protein
MAKKNSPKISCNPQAGFSLIELMIAMAVTLVLTGLATTLLASAFKVRSREDRKSDAIADVQRALNIMTREISNSGFRLPSGMAGIASNGFVPGDSNNQSLRIISNLNGMPDPASPETPDTDVDDVNEDVKFLMYVDEDLGQRYIVRYDKNASTKTTVLANRVDSLRLRYYDERVTYQTTVDANGVCDITDVRNASGAIENEVLPALAKYVVIAVGVTLPAVGTPGVEGYQRLSQVQVTSDVVLRNAIVY